MLGYSTGDITLSHVALAGFICYLGYSYYINFYYPRHVGPLKSIPGPSNELWLTINFVYSKLTGNSVTLFKEIHAKYGPICHLGLNIISINDPEATKLIYTDYKYQKDHRYEFFVENIPSLATTCDRKYHSIRKRMISPAFNLNSVMQLEPLITLHCVKNTVGVINEILDSGKSQIDVYNLFYMAISDVISDLVLGRCFNSLKKPDFPAYKLAEYIVSSWAIKFAFPFLGFLKSKNHPIINQSVVEELKERRQGKYRKDIFQSLIDAKDTETNSTFTDEEIIEEASTLILAGMETTAVGLIWTFYLLGKNPQTYDKLVDELVTAFPDINSDINYEMCKDLPYLKSVIQESLRIKSPASFILLRVVPEGGATICGHFLPEGTVVGSSAPGIHLSERNVEDPESFNPERWLGPEAEKLNNIFFTFGLGQRGCIGKNLAMLEISITIANLIRKFDFSLPEDSTMTEYDSLILRGKEEKLILNVKPRSR